MSLRSWLLLWFFLGAGSIAGAAEANSLLPAFDLRADHEQSTPSVYRSRFADLNTSSAVLLEDSTDLWEIGPAVAISNVTMDDSIGERTSSASRRNAFSKNYSLVGQSVRLQI